MSRIDVSDRFELLKQLLLYEPEKCLQLFKYHDKFYREHKINWYNKLYFLDFKKDGIKDTVIQIFKDIKEN
jgi:hypothetical protein